MNTEKENWFTRVVRNMSAAIPELHKREDETEGQRNARVGRFLAARWSVTYETFRGWKVNSQGRKPNIKKHAQFFADLREYGGAEFGPKGGLVKGTLGRGPDVATFYASQQ